MASELQVDYISGKNVYFLLRNSVGQVWNGSTFAAYNSANYATYPLVAAEQGSSGYFAADMPIVAVGVYGAIAKERKGGSPAEADITVGTGQVDWALTQVASLTSVILSDNVAHGGFGASLVLQQELISNPSGNAVVWQSTGGNGTGWTVSGNGSGRGASLTGGVTGAGLVTTGGATSGAGFVIQNGTNTAVVTFAGSVSDVGEIGLSVRSASNCVDLQDTLGLGGVGINIMSQQNGVAISSNLGDGLFISAQVNGIHLSAGVAGILAPEGIVANLLGTVNGVVSAGRVDIARSVLSEDVGNVEASAPVHSLAVAILKLVSKFDAKLGTVYRTDGVTAKMTQTVTTDITMVPIRSLGVGT